MVAIFTGLGAGFARGSANILGGVGQLGSASHGRGGESISVNAATGNLLVSQQDEFLVGRGLDIGTSRTYNSRGWADESNLPSPNILDDSSFEGASSYAFTNPAFVSASIDYGIAQSGTRSVRAEKIAAGGGGLGHDNAKWLEANFLSPSNSAWTFSLWVRGTAGTEGIIRAIGKVNGVQQWGTDDSAVSYTIQQTGVWQRVSVTLQGGPTRSGVQLRFGFGDNAQVGNVLNFDDLQLEAGTTPTQWVPKSGEMVDGDNGDNWQLSSFRRIFGLTGSLNAQGSSVKRQGSDGSLITYHWDATKSAYVTTDGDGAHDQLSFSGGVWTWTDGSSRVTETYSAYGSNNWRITQAQDRDNGATNFVSYSYVGDKLDKITSADGSWIQYSWSGNNITQVFAQYTNIATGATINQTRTRYAYDGYNRLTQVTVDLSPTDNSISDGRTYVTNYSYHGLTKLVAQISQTDGSLLAMSYDATGRISNISQTVASGDTRTTSFTYGISFTDITGADGQVTRLTYSATGPTSFAPTSLLNWTVYGATTAQQTAQLDGQAAVLTTIVAPGGSAVGVYPFSAVAGETISLTATIMAVEGSATQQSFGLYGIVTAWGEDSNSMARIVSGPGQIIREGGAKWRITGLSTTEATRIEITRTYLQAEDAGACLYIDMPGGYRVDQQLVFGKLLLQSSLAYSAGARQLTEIRYPAAVTGGQPQTVKFGYDSSGNVTSVTDALGRVTSYTYDANGNQLTATDPNANVVTRTYGSKNELLTETRMGSDANGASTPLTTRYAYDSYNQLRYVVSANGHVTEYRYHWQRGLEWEINYPEHVFNSGSAPISEAELDSWRNGLADRSSSTMVHHLRDARGNLSETIRYTSLANGTPTTAEGYSHSFFRYDQAGRLLGKLTAREDNAWTNYVYDGLGRMLASTDGFGATTTILFNDAATSTTVTTAAGATSVSVYNKAGELISETTAGGFDQTATSTFKYDREGRLRQSTDASGSNTFYVYDQAGRRTAEINNVGWMVEYFYDANDRIVGEVRYSGWVSSAMRAALADPNNSLTAAAIRPAADAMDIWAWSVFDTAGRLVQSIDGAGGVSIFEYDQSNRLVRTIGYSNKLTQAQIDAFKLAPPVAPVIPAPNSALDRVTRSFYDRDGRLIGNLDSLGYLTELVYDKAGQKVEEIAYAQKTSSASASTDSFAALRSSVAPASQANVRTRYVYDSLGLLRYSINSQYQVTGIIYYESTLYDASGLVRGTVQYANPIASTTTDFTFDNIRALLAPQSTDANNRRTWSIFDGTRLAFSINEVGAVTGFTYNNSGQVTKAVQYGTARATTTLPSLGEMATWAASNSTDTRVTRNYYSAGGDLRFSVDAEGYVSRFDYDANSRKTRAVHWRSQISVNDQTDIAQIVTLTGMSMDTQIVPLNDMSVNWVDNKYIYLPIQKEILNNFVDENGVTNILSYRGTGNIYASLNGVVGSNIDASVSLYYYDSAGRITSESRAFGEAENSVIQYAYDGLGNRISVTDGNNKTTTFGYDARGQMISATDALDGVTQYQYDAFGNQTAVRDARGHWTYNFYDNLGRLTKTTDASNIDTLYLYNNLGELESVTRAGATTSFQYDKAGRVVRSTDALGFYETYTYDVYGNRTSKTAKSATGSVATGGTTSYTYDRRGLLLTETLPMGSYRADGTLVGSYNAAGTLVPTAVTNTYEYDAYGNRTKMVEAFGLAEARTTEYKYDKNNRLIETIGQTFLGQTPREYMTYDARGNVTSTTNAAGGRSIFYYDDLGRKTVEISAVGTYTKYTYDKNGNVTEIRVYENTVTIPSDGGSEEEQPAAPAGNSRYTTFVYDSLNRMTSSSVHGAKSGSWNGSNWVADTSAITTSYEYDANGNVVKLTDAYGNSIYSYYDSLGQKTHQVDQEGYLTFWQYDANGNVLQERRYVTLVTNPVVGAVPGTAVHGNDRTTVYSYDQAGNRLTETRHNVLVHNGFGQHSNANATVSYLYNGLGQVVRKTEATGDFVDYSYDAAGRLTQETRKAFIDFTNASVTPTVDYYYNGLNNLSRTRQRGAGTTAERVTTYGYDGDKLRMVTDAEGQIRYYSYDQGGRQTHEYYARIRSDGTTDTAFNGNLTSYDVMGRVTATWQADYSGNVWTTRGPVTQLTYNGFGDVVGTSVDGLLQQQNHYDLAGRMTGTTSGDGIWKYFGYDKNGNQTVAITSAGGGLGGSFDAALALVGAENVNATFTQYDKRNMATHVVEEGRRLTTGGALQNLATSRTYTAFGEVASETNAANATITYTYNMMGKLIRSESPAVEIVGENGAAQTIRPAEDYYYDVSGRLVATRDANGSYTGQTKDAGTGNLTVMTLLTGSGYGGTQAQVVAQTHADSGVKRTHYDIHGDARIIVNEIGHGLHQRFDRVGRMVEATRAGGLIDTYSYDILGRLLKHTNNAPGAHGAETTDYDIQGRVIAQRSFGGDVTTTSYVWDSSIAAIGGVATGGWVQTTTMANGLQAKEWSDLFGRVTAKRDLGGNDTSYGYDIAGRMTSSSTNGTLVSFGWFNTGNQATNSGPSGTATYGYDVTGNRTSEMLVNGVVIKNQTATYDALGRMKTWAEAGTATSPAASTVNHYDASGNIRRTVALYTMLDGNGNASGTASGDYWYRYDNMNRLVTDKGQLSGAAGAAGTVIVRGGLGSGGRDIFYDAAGQRVSVATTVGLDGTWVYLTPPNQLPSPDDELVYSPGWMQESRENFTYDAAGRMVAVHNSFGAQVFDSAANPGVFAALPAAAATGGFQRGSFTYDLMGRLTLQEDRGSVGLGPSMFIGVTYSRSIDYNAKGQVTSDTVSTKKGRYNEYGKYDTFVSVTSYDYGSGSGYALGSVVSQSATNSKQASGSSSWTSEPGTLTTTSYVWRDGAVQNRISYDGDTGSGSNPVYTTDMHLNALGQLTGATVADGVAKSVAYTLDESGQIIRRDETRTGAPGEAAPHEVFYRFAGRQLGLSGNNGGAEATYAASVQSRSAARPDAAASTAGLFRDGTRTGMASYADFSQSYDAFTSGYQGSAGGVYSVQTGDSLQSIAQGLWGDASLWYKLAEANGLSGSATLIEGQVLVLPTGVSSARHNASTFTPYDAASAIGDLSPTTPKPPKAPKCGMMGQILLAVIAVAVSIALPGGGGVLGAIVNGAIGSAVSQAVGVATGIQDKFSFKGVAISALSAGVTAGLGDKFALFGKMAEGAGGGVTAIANAAAKGALASAITQGVATATGLQSKFSWVGVAAAGVSAGVGQGLGHRLRLSDLETKVGRSAGNIAGHTLVGTASSIASAATRSAITGTSFGDNVMAAIPDAIGQTIGRALGGALQGHGSKIENVTKSGPKNSSAPNGSMSDIIVNQNAINRAVMSASGLHSSNIFDDINFDFESSIMDPDMRARVVLARIWDETYGAAPSDSQQKQRSSSAGAAPVAASSHGVDGGAKDGRAYLHFAANIGPGSDYPAWMSEEYSNQDYARYGSDLAADAGYFNVDRIALPAALRFAADPVYGANWQIVADQLQARVDHVNTLAAPVLRQYDMLFGGMMAAPFAIVTGAPLLGGGFLSNLAGGTTLLSGADHLGGAGATLLGRTDRPSDIIYSGASSYVDGAAAVTNAAHLGASGIRLLTSGLRSTRAAESVPLSAPGWLTRMRGVQATEIGAKRISTTDLAALQTQHGTEFAQIYVTGPGRNGGGGTYYLLQGNAGTVNIPLRADVRLINHSHPEYLNGQLVPLRASPQDRFVLRELQRVGSPQLQSQVVPEVGQPFTFRGRP